jgi:hypothetical protein
LRVDVQALQDVPHPVKDPHPHRLTARQPQQPLRRVRRVRRIRGRAGRVAAALRREPQGEAQGEHRGGLAAPGARLEARERGEQRVTGASRGVLREGGQEAPLLRGRRFVGC